jgi:hypothetical protein
MWPEQGHKTKKICRQSVVSALSNQMSLQHGIHLSADMLGAMSPNMCTVTSKILCFMTPSPTFISGTKGHSRQINGWWWTQDTFWQGNHMKVQHLSALG